MAWFYLFLASVSEIGWAIGLKYTHNWTRLWPSTITLGIMCCSILFLSLAIKHIPLGTAYAIWTGLGAAGTAIAGIYLFGEAATPARLLSMGVIAIGVIGLKLSTS